MDDFSALALVLASAGFAALKRKRNRDDPEDAAQEVARMAAKAEAEFQSDYEQARRDNAEYERSPRAYRRRLQKASAK